MGHGWVTLQLLLVFCLIVLIAGVKGLRLLSDEEDLELERELKILNKPPVKTIQAHGDIFDCIDIYKQPALDHPKLKNHKIQMRPSSLPKEMSTKVSSDAAILDLGFNESCPSGTVLIRRTQKEDLINAMDIQYLKKRYDTNDVFGNKENHYAVLRSAIGTYYGSKAVLNIYGFPLIASTQATVSQIWVIGGGPPNLASSVQAGWHVLQGVNDDYDTHFFTYWTADGYNKTGCINLVCKGFVQIASDIAPGNKLKPLSTYGGTQYEITILIFKDQATGNWWLVYGRDNKYVGYWPKELFDNLDFAAEVDWGGVVYSPLYDFSPPMGSGHFPSEGPNKVGYFHQIQLVDNNNALHKPDDGGYQRVADIPRYYDIGKNYDQGGTVGYGFAYGGPGGYKE